MLQPTKNVNLELNYKYDDPKDPQRLYYRSDHYNFAKHNIPVAFFFDGIHEDYHKPTDTPDKIDYPLLQKRTQLVFATAWELANRPDRIIVDGKNTRYKKSNSIELLYLSRKSAFEILGLSRNL
jgi:hypothetical protein